MISRILSCLKKYKFQTVKIIHFIQKLLLMDQNLLLFGKIIEMVVIVCMALIKCYIEYC